MSREENAFERGDLSAWDVWKELDWYARDAVKFQWLRIGNRKRSVRQARLMDFLNEQYEAELEARAEYAYECCEGADL